MAIKIVRLVILLSVFVILTACSSTDTVSTTVVETMHEDTSRLWKTASLTNVHDQKSFSIEDFNGKPIFLESFAVWCPTCLKQQQEMKKFVDKGTHPEVVHISLDTDPNENVEQVRKHAEKNDLDWFFSIPSQDFTQSLIEEFGIAIVSAPSAPVVLICPRGEATLLGRGVKDVSELEDALRDCT